MGNSLRTGAAATALAAVLSFGSAAEAVAGGGDFVGGMIVGGVIGTILGHEAGKSRPAPRRVHRPTYDPAVVEYWRTVQSALNEIGIPVGRPDGVPGGKTRRGVRVFQASIGVEPSGQLAQDQYNELMRQANVALGMGGGTVNQPAYAAMQPYPEEEVPLVAPQQGIVSAAVTRPVAIAPATAQPPAVEPQVASAAPVKPADTRVLDSLMSPAKPLSDEEADRLEDASTVFGVYIGDTKAIALKAFTDGIGSCTTTGALTECSNKSDAYTDKASFATTGSGDSESVFYLARSIDFTTPLPKEAIVAKLGETLKPIVEDDDMTLATSPACDRSTATAAAGRDRTIGAYARSPVTGATGLSRLVGDCVAYFHAAVPLKDGQATGLRVYLFDSRALPPLIDTAAKALPDELKF